MLKIIKYDLMKKYKLISIVLVITALMNLLSIVKLGMEGSALFLGLFPMAMILLYVIDIIKMYSDDLNKKSGYMLFMTPNSGYKIIVSKVITAILESFAILLIYFIFIVINALYISAVQGFNLNININELVEAINMFLSGSLGFNLGHLFLILFTILIFAIGFILSAYTAITVRKSIFSESKFGGFFSFIIFVALNWLTSYVSGKIMSILPSDYNIIVNNFETFISAGELAVILLPVIILSIVESILMAIGSGYLLEKKINL